MRCLLKTSPKFPLETRPNFREYPQEKMIERARYIFAQLVSRQRDWICLDSPQKVAFFERPIRVQKKLEFH